MMNNYLKLLTTVFFMGLSVILSAQGLTCGEATDITPGEYTAPEITGAGASNLCFTGGTGAVWYSYTATETAPIVVTSTFDALMPDTRVSIYTGACDALFCVAQDDDNGDGLTSLVNFDGTAGETYLIEWDDRWSASGFDFSLVTEFSAPDCVTLTFPVDAATEVVLDADAANALTLTWDLAAGGEIPTGLQLFIGTDPAELNLITTIANTESSIIVNGFDFNETYYWALIPTNFGNDATGCDVFSFTTAFMVGDTDGDGVLDGDDCAPEDPLLYLGATCDDGNANTFADAIQEDCTCAGVMPLPGELCELPVVAVEGITTCPGPISGSGASNVCFGSGGTNAFWYAYTPAQDGQVTVTSSISPTTSDTRVSIYTGDCSALTCVAQDDDGGGALTSTAVFDVISTTTYMIEWDDRWASAEFDFEISFLSAISDADADGILDIDDNCVDIANTDQLDTDLDGMGDVCDEDDDNDGNLDEVDCDPLDANVFFGATCDDGDEATFTDSIQDDCSCVGILPATNSFCDGSIEVFVDVVYTDVGPFAGGGIVNSCFADGIGANANWYLFVPTEDGLATVDASISPVLNDTRISVYTGSCDALTCFAQDDDGGEELTSLVSFDAVAGTAYYLEWDDRWSNGGFDFIITLLSATTDTDGDGIFDIDDNCIDIANADQADLDLDAIGDLCDDNIDGDVDLGDVDCDDMDANVFFGSACDDGDDTTTNDVIQEDCTCLGVIPPVNMECDGSITVFEDVVITDPGPFAGESATNGCFGEGAINANWYIFTVTGDEMLEVTVSSEIDANLNDTRVSIYTGTCDALDCVAFDDDGGEGFTSLTTFIGTQGTTYFIEWDDRWSTQGFDWIITTEVAVDTDADGIADLIDNCPEMANDDQADLDQDGIGDVCDDDIDGDGSLNDVDCDALDGTVFVGAPCDDGDAETFGDALDANCVCAGFLPAPGDICDLGIAVNEGTFTAVGPSNSLSGAVNNCFADGGVNANWYTYTATESGLVTVGSDISAIDTRLSVYTGDCGNLSCLAFDDDGGGALTSIVSFDVTEGDVFFIEWDDRWSSEGFDFYIEVVVGIEDVNSVDSGVQLFPNPVVGDLTVQFKLDESSEVTYEVYDISGKLMMTEMESSEKGQVRHIVDVNNLSSGFYLMKIIVDDQSVTKKFNVLK